MEQIATIEVCPHCKGKNIFTQEDLFGKWKFCLTCGWEKPLSSVISQEELEKERNRKKTRRPTHNKIRL